MSTMTPRTAIPALRGRLAGLSLWHALPLLAVAVCAVSWSSKVRDPDQFWHVLMGQDILENGRFTGDPSWVYGPSRAGWVTTQWLAEVLMAAGYRLVGWNVGLILSVLVGVGLLGWWGWILLRPGVGLPARSVVYAGLVIVAMGTVQERPSLFSFCLLTLVSLGVRRWILAGVWPRWWVPPALVVVWVQFHGAWLVVPLLMVVCAGVDWWSSRRTDRLLQRAAWVAMTVAASVASPAGVYGMLAVFPFSEASGGRLEEWLPTAVDSSEGVGLLVLVGVLVVAWARSGNRIPLRELVLCSVLVLFALLAYRNVSVSMILLAPVVGWRAALSWPKPQPPSGVVDVLVVAVSALLMVGVLLNVGVRLVTVSVAEDSMSRTVLDSLARMGGERRVLASYGWSGRIEALVGEGGRVRVAIDGRADRYGGEALSRYADLMQGRGEWEKELAALAPTDVVVEPWSPLARLLVARGWMVTAEDERAVHLSRPGD